MQQNPWRALCVVLTIALMTLVACTSDSNDGSGQDPNNNAPNNDAPNNDVSNNDTPSTALLDEALGCEPNPGNGVAPGDDLLKVTLDAPDAICNDGSPAVIFVRRAANEENQNNWVFHLQGGGGCGGADCAQRWCGRNEKMTSTATPPGMVGKGIMRRSPQNTLGDANQVFLYYCSSDNWSGRATDAVIPATEDTPDFRLHFRGDAIHNAALDALEAGVTSDDGTVQMPPFEGDGFALWTGTSGGCHGVAHTADRFAARASTQGFSPFIVCDANYGANPEFLPDGPPLEAFLEERAGRFELTDQFANANRDQSCMEALSDDPFLCDLPGYVLGNHVTQAPLFIRMDLADPSISDSYLAAGFSIEEFAQGVRASLLAASQSQGTETPPRPVAVYGPACQQHVGLTNDDWFLEATVNVNGAEVTFHDAVVAWMGGRDVVAVDTTPPSLSTCSTTTDETD